MPTLDDMTLDGPAVHEQIVQQLHRMDQNLQQMGLGPMSPDDLRLAYGKIKTGVAQVVKQRNQPPPSPTTTPPAPAPNLPLSTFAEGGLISDSSGQETARIRNQLGIR